MVKVEEDPSKEKRSRGQFRREVETLRKEVSRRQGCAASNIAEVNTEGSR